MILVTQSWDDGVHDDAQLVELLRKYKAKATFNLIAGAYKETRSATNWQYEGHDVQMLAHSELVPLFHDFEVASHTVTHPRLPEIAPEKVAWELSESRRILEDLFQRSIRGFAYPYGAYNDSVKEAVRKEGYAYARLASGHPAYTELSNEFSAPVVPVGDPMEFSTTVHVLNPRFWDEFDHVKKQGGAFHFWGHSYEFTNEKRWADFEEKLARLSADPDVQWVTNLELLDFSSKI